MRGAPRPGLRQRRLGQNLLADPNLLALVVREAAVGPADAVLEIGGGGGALSAPLAPLAGHLYVIELDERFGPRLEPLAGPNVTLIWGDAMKLGLSLLDPPPTKVVSNLPYSIATPILLRTIEELPSVHTWLVMVQREIAERLRAGPGTRIYGAPSVLVQLACDVELVRTVPRTVFSPRPRVDSALIRLRRHGSAAPPPLRQLVRDAFAHRRKVLARSLELARPGRREAAAAALAEMGLPPGARAESLSPQDFALLALKLNR